MGASATVVEAIDQTEVAMMLVSADHTVSYANGPAHDLLGYEHGALNGLSLRWLSPPSRHGELQNLDAVFAGQGMRRIRSLALRSDGSRVEVAMKLEPCRDGTGKVVAASVTYEPISPGSSVFVSQPPSSMQPRMSQAPRISQLPGAGPSGPANASQSARPSGPATRPAPGGLPSRSSAPAPRSASQPARSAAPQPASNRPALPSQPANTQSAPRASARPAPPPTTRPPAPPVSAVQARVPSVPAPRSAPPPPPRSSNPPAPDGPSWVTASLASKRPQPTTRGLAPVSSAPPPPPSAPPQSGSRPIAGAAPTEAKAPPRDEAFANISEQLESAVQLLGWLEQKLNANEAGFVDARDRTRALVVLSDLQALIRESKDMADAGAGAVDVPKAPKLPRM